MTEEPLVESAVLTTPQRRFWVTRLRSPLAWLIGLMFVAIAVLVWLVWQGSVRLDTTRQELSRRLTDSDSTQREMQAGTRQNRESLDALQAKVGALDARFAEMQSQQLALEAMYQELSRVRDDRLLAEIEQTVSIAAQQLQLAGNVEAALIALQGAEVRLAKSAQPQFLNLRKLIARDIERLKSLPAADVPGIALKLDSLLAGVNSLPLAFEQRPVRSSAERPADGEAPSAPEWRSIANAWLAELWRELRQLVHIERIDRPDPGLLAPREVFFLRENLRLRLLSARLALLARDGRSFHSDIGQASAWIEQYFDTRAPAVAEAQAQLKQLAGLDVMRESADAFGLGETLAALRNFKFTRERGAER
jgi:uroporphyrin-III C-methyltransferase